MDKCCIASLSQKPMTWERDYPVAGSALTEGGVATKRTYLRVTSSARCTDTSRGASMPIRTRPLAHSKTTIVMLSPIVICSPAFRLSTSMIPSNSFEKTLTRIFFRSASGFQSPEQWISEWSNSPLRRRWRFQEIAESDISGWDPAPTLIPKAEGLSFESITARFRYEIPASHLLSKFCKGEFS